jgi:hypothetical protein
MKKYIVLFVLVLLTTIANAQPKLEIEGGNTYDWGKSNPAQSPLKATIKLKNVGTEVLKIAEVKPGCGCTTAPLDKYDIQPNDFALMSVTLNISSYTDEVTKSIRITSNDPQSGDSYLFLKTFVFRPIKVDPSVYLGKSIIKVDEEVIFDYKLKNQTDKPIKVTGITLFPTQTASSLTKGEVIPPNQEKAYTLKLTPKEIGRINGSVKIQTDNKSVEEVTIYFYGNVVKDDPNQNK